MNDAEIINGLEDSIEFICKKCQKDCKRTPCDMHFYKNIRDLIKRQKSEIEQLKFKNLALSQNRITMPERLEIVNNARDKAIREFADKLKNCAESSRDYSEWVFAINESALDNLVKQVTGGEDNA